MITVVQTEPAITLTPPTEQAKEKPAEDKKTLVLFGITMELENPKRKNNTEDFTENQKKVLADLGLDGPGVSFKQKRDILQTIYDEKCRTEQSLMMLQNCEPIRQIVQTLALQLLETLQPADMAAISVSEQDKPVVTYTKDEAKKTTTVSITFGPGQLQQLSAERPKNNKNASKPKNKAQEKGQGPKKAEEPAPSPAASPTKQQKNAATATEEQKEDAESVSGLVAASVASTVSESADATQTESSIAQPSTAMSLAAEPSPDTKGGDVVTQIGIKNPAKVNCYCVSVVQMLFSLPEVRDAVESYECTTIKEDDLTEEAVGKITTAKVLDQVTKSGRESVDPMFLCVLQQLFRSLQAKVTSLTNPVSLDTEGTYGLSDVYTQYLMKVYVATEEKSINQEQVEKSITQQQDAAAYLNMIVEIFHANEHFQEVAKMFQYRVDTETRCGDQTKMAGPPKEKVSDPPIQLYMSEYIAAPSFNKTEPNNVSLEKLIHFSERADERTKLTNCGDGKGTKRVTYHITDENKYLVFYTNRFEFDKLTQKRVHREDLKLQAQPHLVVDNTSYHIHGAVLYGSHGTTGGHYVYLRVNDAGADDTDNADNADKLPAILYNNEKVSDNKGDWTIASKSFLLVYRRQPEGHVSKAVKVAPEVVEKEGQEVETEVVGKAEVEAEVGAKEGQEVETEAVEEKEEGIAVELEPISGLQPIPQVAAQGKATSTASPSGILSQARSSSNISPSNDPNNPNNQNEPAAKKQRTKGGIHTLKTKLKKVQRTLQNRPSTTGGKKTQKHAKAKKCLSRKKKARRAKK